MNAPAYTTVIYENVDFRWWNPFTWYRRISEFSQSKHASVYLWCRFRRMYICTDDQGHEMFAFAFKKARPLHRDHYNNDMLRLLHLQIHLFKHIEKLEWMNKHIHPFKRRRKDSQEKTNG